MGQTKITNNTHRILFSDAILPAPGELNIDIDLTYSEQAKYIVYWISENLGISKYRYSSREQYSFPCHYARAGVYEDMVYVDVKSFYYSLYSRFWNIKYKRLHYFGAVANIKPILDKLGLHKLVKVSIFGIFSSGSLIAFKTEKNRIKYYDKRIYNALRQFDTVNFIYDCSQCLCFLAKTFGAVYCNTDGFIISRKSLLAFVEEIESLGFQWSIKAEGDAEIKALGHYRFGDLKTKNWDRLNRTINHDNILADKSLCDWLFRSMRKHEKEK